MSKSEIGTRPHASMFERGFTVLDNTIFDNLQISPLARLLLMYLVRYATCPNYVAYNGTKMKWLDCERKKLQRLHHELIFAGYMRLNKGGKGGGSYYEFHAEPIFYKASEVIPKNSERSKKGLSQKGTVPKRAPILSTDPLSNTDLKKQQQREVVSIDKEAIAQAQTAVAVFVEGEKKKVANGEAIVFDANTDVLIQDLGRIDVTNALAVTFIQRHGRDRIEKVLKAAMTKDKPAGYLRNALAGNWDISERKSKEGAPKEGVNAAVSLAETNNHIRASKVRDALKEENLANPEKLSSRIGGLREALKQGRRERSVTS